LLQKCLPLGRRQHAGRHLARADTLLEAHDEALGVVAKVRREQLQGHVDAVFRGQLQGRLSLGCGVTPQNGPSGCFDFGEAELREGCVKQRDSDQRLHSTVRSHTGGCR